MNITHINIVKKREHKVTITSLPNTIIMSDKLNPIDEEKIKAMFQSIDALWLLKENTYTLYRDEDKDVLLESEGYNQAADLYIYAWATVDKVLFSESKQPQSGDRLYTQTLVDEALQVLTGSSRIGYMNNQQDQRQEEAYKCV